MQYGDKGMNPAAPAELAYSRSRERNDLGCVSERPTRPGGESSGGDNGALPLRAAPKRRTFMRARFFVSASAAWSFVGT